MNRCISSQKVGVFFPDLVMILCKKAGVSITSTEQLLKPSRSIIVDTLFQRYIEVQAKQIKYWNKRQQEESRPIFQEFAKQNNIRVPNYTPTWVGQRIWKNKKKGKIVRKMRMTKEPNTKETQTIRA
ncbi:hypothetical protein PVK06_020461 [Gossypium arboreum]|uniref:Uncharacterized protein n=1 Tax=Gossypium arboreum TaxID=29729 RepID=A0ABR0PMF2_GOSAR|nr:hypothetical protein PVK06_020461 [Gossypium arboreum]